MPKVDTTALNALSGKIQQLPVRTTISPYEVVKELAPTIHEALARGQDLVAISRLLTTIGVRLAPATIGNYLRRASREGAPPPCPIGQPVDPSPPSASGTSSAVTAPPSPLDRAREIEASTSPQGGRFELVQDKDV